MMGWSWNYKKRENIACEGKFSLAFSDGTAVLSLWYDVREAPLTLTAAEGELRLVVLPHRLELWSDGRLCDEEWPYGTPKFDRAMLDAFGETADYTETAEALPDVIGQIGNAQGWYPGGGIFVGDCMPYADGGRYHVLWLKDRRHHRSKWSLGAHQWEHISTADFKTWDVHPMAVAITKPEEGSICTGSHMRVGDIHYLYYTVRMADGSPAPIRRSVSRDGFHFTKDEGFGFTLSEKYHRASARDPKIVRADDGWHMFVTTSELALGRGALAHLFSADGENWREFDSIYISPDGDQPECSDYFEFGGKYYLVFSHHAKAEYRVSDAPFDGWRRPENPYIPCGAVPKSAMLGGRLIFTGCVHSQYGYAGTMTFTEAAADASGELHFAPVPETGAAAIIDTTHAAL